MNRSFVFSNRPTLLGLQTLSGAFSNRYSKKFLGRSPGIWIHNVQSKATDAYALVANAEPWGNGLWLNWLGVDPYNRRQGYAESLLTFLQSMYPAIGVLVRHRNAPAIRLYCKMNFQLQVNCRYIPHRYTYFWTKPAEEYDHDN